MKHMRCDSTRTLTRGTTRDRTSREKSPRVFGTLYSYTLLLDGLEMFTKNKDLYKRDNKRWKFK